MKNKELKGQNGPGLKPETASDLTRRHLKDKTHKTTEEELKNVRLDLGIEEKDFKKREPGIIPANTPTVEDDEISKSNEKQILKTPLDVLT